MNKAEQPGERLATVRGCFYCLRAGSNSDIRNVKKGFALIEILIGLAVIMVIYYVLMNSGLKGPALQRETVKSLSGQGMNTTSYKTVLDSSKKIIDSAVNRGSE